MFMKINSAEDVPGYTNINQHNCYKELVKKLPNKPKILEIGCLYGKSTWGWLDALPHDASYFVLDNFQSKTVDHTEIKKLQKFNQRYIFDKIIKQHPNNKIIKTIWQMNGKDWIEDLFTADWDLVYLDDDHSYEVVYNWLVLFQNVKIVCGDDYSLNHIGVVEAVDEYESKYNAYKQIHKSSNFFVLKNT